MLAIALALLANGQPVNVIAEPALTGVPCDYGENRPRMPGADSGRDELYDLLLGQDLRRRDRDAIAAVLRQRFPGEATDAFLAMLDARPSDSDDSVRTFEAIAARYRGSDDPLLQVEAARARAALIAAQAGRHIASAEDDGSLLWVAGTYRQSAAGRRWSAMVDEFLRDYRDRGERFDEFVAPLEMEALIREAADRTPGDFEPDQRFLDPEVADVGAWLRERMQALIDRFGAAPNERVQRTVADAMDMLARYDLGRAALLPLDRRIIARFRNARDIGLRHTVNASWHRLRMSLAETDDDAAVREAERDHEAWRAANLDLGCA